MVSEDKNEIIKTTKKNKLSSTDIKALIIGAIIFLFFPVVAYQKNIEFLTVFAAAGPLYIGYTSRTYLKGGILGLIGAIPLLFGTFKGALGPINELTSISSFSIIFAIICISILGLGLLFGILGTYLYQSRFKAKAEYQAKKPKGTKNRPIKENKKNK